MIIQLALILAFLGLILYAVLQRFRSRIIGNVIILISLIGIFFVAYPEFTGIIANAVGVGRGADLILYWLVMITLLTILNVHLRLRSLHEEITELARAIAILSAVEPLK